MATSRRLPSASMIWPASEDGAAVDFDGCLVEAFFVEADGGLEFEAGRVGVGADDPES